VPSASAVSRIVLNAKHSFISERRVMRHMNECDSVYCDSVRDPWCNQSSLCKSPVCFV